MKIVIVSLGFGREDNLGGSVRVASTNAIALAKLGHHISYICTNRIDKTKKLYSSFQYKNIEGVDVYYLNTATIKWWPGDFGPHLSEIPQEVIQITKNADIIHLNEYRSFLSIAISTIASFKKIPIVIQPHGTYLNHGNRVVIKKIFNICFNTLTRLAPKYFIASTKNEKEIFINSGINKDSITIIPNGVSVVSGDNYFKGTFREKNLVKKSDFLILSIGRLDKLKGFQYVIDSLNFLPNNIKYFVIGPDQQNYLTELNLLIKERNLEERVRFLGPINDRKILNEVILNCDLFIVPSVVEAFGMVILEASLCKTPIILSENCSILSDLPTNVALNVKLNPKNIADSILKLYNDPNLMNELANAFYEFTLNNYTVDSVVQKIESFYLKIKLKTNARNN